MAWMLRAARGAPAVLHELGIEDRAPPGGQARGEGVERAAHFVDLGDPARLERRDEEAAAGRVEDQAVLLQQAQGLQHRLARDREIGGDRLLRQARARRDRAVADRGEQGAVDLVDEVGRGLQLDEVGGHRCG